jgi:hypothetical protein
MKFYVYVLIDPITDKVFYVGKGTGNRLREHKKEAVNKKHYNKHLENTILKILSTGNDLKYDKIFSTDIEEEAFIKEIETILFFGLSNLCNLTEGGEGSSGYKHTEEAIEKMKAFVSQRDWNGKNNPNYGGGNWTEETKKRFSEYQKVNLLGEKNPFFGKNHSDIARAKMSKYHKGKILTEVHKLKISENHAFKGKKRPEHSIKMSGENNPKAKLTFEIVNEIRLKYNLGDTSYRKLAVEYHVDHTTVADIIKGKIWRLT